MGCYCVRVLGFFPSFFFLFYAFQFSLPSGMVKCKEQIYDKVILESKCRWHLFLPFLGRTVPDALFM